MVTNLWTAWRKKAFTSGGLTTDRAAKKPNIYVNLSAEWWSIVGQLIEHRRIVIPNDEKLIAQLTSREKLYDSKGREKLESKADLKARGVESPDRADALIGSLMLGIGSDPYAINPEGRKQYHEELARCAAAMRESVERTCPFSTGWVSFTGF